MRDPIQVLSSLAAPPRTDLAPITHGGHRARPPERGAQGLAAGPPLRLLRAAEFERRRRDEPDVLGRRRAREKGDGLGGRPLQSADGVLRGAAASSGRARPVATRPVVRAGGLPQQAAEVQVRAAALPPERLPLGHDLPLYIE